MFFGCRVKHQPTKTIQTQVSELPYERGGVSTNFNSILLIIKIYFCPDIMRLSPVVGGVKGCAETRSPKAGDTAMVGSPTDVTSRPTSSRRGPAEGGNVFVHGGRDLRGGLTIERPPPIQFISLRH